MTPRHISHIVTVAAGILLAAWPAPAQVVPSAESPQVVLDRFAATFSTRDVDAVSALFAPDATFFGSSYPGLVEPMRGPEGARAYFARPFAPGGPKLDLVCRTAEMREPVPALVLMAALCHLNAAQPDGLTAQRSLRVSATLMRSQAGWRFTNLHVCAAPPAPQPR